MRALMNLAIEPAMHLFEVSALVVAHPSQQAVKRVLKVLADTPPGAVRIVRDRYPLSRSHQVLAVQADGREVNTIEGLSESGALADLQAAFIKRNALQCGFCTSGMLLAAHELVETHPEANREEVREWISGNYCRCTGYQAIVDAICDVLAARKGVAA